MNQKSPYIDELSGVYSRRYLKERQQATIETFIKQQIPFSLVMVDIDHFKAINDTYGHLRGDSIIKEFAFFLQGALRKFDTVIRYGGDEFVCVMPETKRQDIEWIYRRILKQCQERSFAGLKITFSAGVATYPDDGKEFETLLQHADQALYDAKRSGRARLGISKKKKVQLPMKIFIDRVEEKEALEKLLQNSTARLGIALVKGNVGVGKTRLSRHVLEDITGREIVWSDCLYLTENIAYYPIREALKYHIKRWGVEVLSHIPAVYKLEICKLLPELTEQIGEKTEGIELVLDKYRLYESIRRILKIGEREKVVVIDNIQWIDKESIEVVKYLMRTLRDNPISFIFIFRTEEVTGVLEDFLLFVSREVDVEDVELRPFGYADVRESIKSIIGEDPGEDLVQYVLRESGGIPFYVEEIMRELVDQRFLAVEEDSWIFREPETEIVPKSIEDVAMRKYRSLSKEGQQVLNIASVIGWFDIDIIKRISGFNEGEVVGLINDIQRLGMVKYLMDRFEFSEEISRNAIYKRFASGIKGMELHKKVATHIKESSKGKENEVIELLAVHYYRGQEKEKGIRYCMEAGARAKEKYANRYAIRYYGWAIDLLKAEQGDDKTQERIDCLSKRAEVHSLVGNHECALRDLEEASTGAKTLGDKKREIEILLKKATLYRRISRFREAIAVAERCRNLSQDIGDDESVANSLNTIGSIHMILAENEQAMEFYNEALELFRESGGRSGEAKVLNNIGSIYLGLDYNRALKFYEDSLIIYRELGDKAGASKICNNIGIIYTQLGDHDRALTYHEESLNKDTELGDKFGEATTCTNIGNIYSYLEEYRSALNYYERVIRVTREIGDKHGEAVGLTNTGLIYDGLGEYHNALKMYHTALDIARELGDRMIEAHSLGGQAHIYQNLGDFHNARSSYGEAQKIIEQVNVGWLKFGIMCGLGELHLMCEETDKAKKLFDAAYSVAEDLKSERFYGEVYCFLSRVYLANNEYEEFKKTVQEIENLGEEVKTDGLRGDVDLQLGRYYTKIEDFDKAATHLRASLKIYEKLEKRLSIGETYYYLAQMEFAKNKRHPAKGYLEKSLGIFNSLGARAWKERVEDALKKASCSL